MWWANGWRGEKIRCYQTGYYGMAMDTINIRMLHLGSITDARAYEQAVAQDNRVIFDLPPAHLRLTVTVGNREYTCIGTGRNGREETASGARLIESGRFLQRGDIENLSFMDAEDNLLTATGRLEVIAWPDRLALLLEVTPPVHLKDAKLWMSLKHRGGEIQEQSEPTDWAVGSRQTVYLVLAWGQEEVESQDVAQVIATAIKTDNNPVSVSYDDVRGWYEVSLPPDPPKSSDKAHLDRIAIRLSNPGSREKVFRLNFAKAPHVPGITGMAPMLRDIEGNPTGVPVQISKNWHKKPDLNLRYEGAWFHGFSILRVPAESELDLEFNIALNFWGPLPVASHAQLCLIGWGVNQLWDQAAIGSWGESICYDPDVNLNRAVIDDIRPLLVWGMNADKSKWNWTNNVGGGDFLVYFDKDNRKQFFSRMRAAYISCGPNLTQVTYAGVTADGHIAARITVSTPRCDDINRAYHRFRYEVLKPTPFSRLAFYQLGADNYNDHQFNKIAYGNTEGVLEEWQPVVGGLKYSRQHIRCEGTSPWFSLHEGINQDEKGGAWANRGLVIRSWRARLNGRDAPIPHAAIFGTNNGPPSANVEISLPPDTKTLQPGDFVECLVELLVMPMDADDYYGPNTNLRSDLVVNANTWKPIFRQAVGNNLRLQVRRGQLRQPYPVRLAVDADETAEIEITGGMGYVPITFAGLRNYKGYELWQEIASKRPRVDQSALGYEVLDLPPRRMQHQNDFGQTDFDAVTGEYRLTYNISLDSPDDKPRIVRLTFKPAT